MQCDHGVGLSGSFTSVWEEKGGAVSDEVRIGGGPGSGASTARLVVCSHKEGAQQGSTRAGAAGQKIQALCGVEV